MPAGSLGTTPMSVVVSAALMCGSGTSGTGVRPIPIDRLRQAGGERRAGAEPELVRGALDVEHPPRLAVRFRRVPHDLAFETCGLPDEHRQVVDRDLLAAAEVHRLALLVFFGGRDDAVRRIFDVEELARRRAVAPQHDLALAARAGLDELADHR